MYEADVPALTQVPGAPRRKGHHKVSKQQIGQLVRSYLQSHQPAGNTIEVLEQDIRKMVTGGTCRCVLTMSCRRPAVTTRN